MFVAFVACVEFQTIGVTCISIDCLVTFNMCASKCVLGRSVDMYAAFVACVE